MERRTKNSIEKSRSSDLRTNSSPKRRVAGELEIAAALEWTDDDDPSTFVDHIRKIAAFNARNNDTHKLLKLQMESWWSRKYERPLKDPLLQTYTLEELIYEYYDHVEREAAAKEANEQDDDRIEEERQQEALDWADQMEAEEAEEAAKLQRMAAEQKAKQDPSTDPENVDWMNKVIEDEKERRGEDFGEDLSLDFER